MEASLMIWSRIKSGGKKTSRLRCIDIVNTYGALLEDQPLGTGGTISDDILPFDKSLIKAALIDLANTPGVSEAQIATLHNGFLWLACFQIGGGGKSALWNSPVHSPNMTRSKISAFFEGLGPTLEAERKLSSLVDDEQSELEAEWNIRTRLARAMPNA